jgi:hypothetical protein
MSLQKFSASYVAATRMAKAEPMSDYLHPKLEVVEAIVLYRLRTTWSTGEVLDVNCGDPSGSLQKTPRTWSTQRMCQGSRGPSEAKNRRQRVLGAVASKFAKR